tara:strand:+ start:203 stop:1561 length:1359 start_codon:yes stop_codon:yes gene_type:complete
MSHLKSACEAFILFKDNHKESLFKSLVDAHCSHINVSLRETIPSLKEGVFDASKAKEVATSLFISEPTCRYSFLKTLLSKECSTRETIEWSISLIEDVDYDVDIKVEKSQYYSNRTLIDLVIGTLDKSLFDAVMKCHIDWHGPNKDLSKITTHHSFETLFAESLSSASKMLKQNKKAVFVFDHLLTLPLPTTESNTEEVAKSATKTTKEPSSEELLKKRYRQAICFALNDSIDSAAIFAKHGYLLRDFTKDDFQYNNSDYVTSTIKEIYNGFGAEILLNGTSLEGYSKSQREEEKAKMLAILEVLRSDGAKDKEYLSPFFVKESVMEVLSVILKDVSKSSGSGYGASSKVRVNEQTSSTLSFFEEIIGVDSIAFNDKTSTKTLLQLSNTNYGEPIAAHYVNKLDMQYFAKNAGGIEQARFVIRSFNVDPLTVLQYVKKESIKRQLMEDLASL